MNREISTSDSHFLDRAVRIGRRGWGWVHPNPLVGCVLVRDGEVVGEGWHQELGGPHAEVHALRGAGRRAKGATAYVSLEPCNHHGRTPPCSNALMEAGVERVVYGGTDPGEQSGGGAARLRAAGLEVLGPVLTAEEARRENPAFFFNHEHAATYVAVKLAQTLDGRIAEAPGRRTAVTGPEARSETHRLRAGFHGVMVGSNTVLVDDPLLTVREEVATRKQPTRIILDARGRTLPEARVFRDLPTCPLLFFTSHETSAEVVRSWTGAGAQVHRVPMEKETLSLAAVLETCWDVGILSIFCEGGGVLASSLIREGWARRLFLFVAPFVLGERGVPAFVGLESREAWEGWRHAEAPEPFGRDSLLVLDRMD